MLETKKKKILRITLVIAILIAIAVDVFILMSQPYRDIIFTKHPTSEDYALLKTAAIEFSESFNEDEVEEKYKDIDISFNFLGDILEVKAVSELYGNEVIASYPVTYSGNGDNLKVHVNHELATYEENSMFLGLIFILIFLSSTFLPSMIYFMVDTIITHKIKIDNLKKNNKYNN